jgi:hypothetical protein
VNVSREVEKPEFILSEPAREQAKRPKTPVGVLPLHFVNAALVGVMEGDHDSERAIRQDYARF